VTRAGGPIFAASFAARVGSTLSRLERFCLLVFSPSSCPLRLNLHCSHLAERVVPETTPSPIFGFFAQFPLYWVARNVTQRFLEVGMAANVAVIITLLPEMSGTNMLTGNRLLGG